MILRIDNEYQLGVANEHLHDAACDMQSVVYDESEKVFRLRVWRECCGEGLASVKKFLLWELQSRPYQEGVLELRNVTHMRLSSKTAITRPLFGRMVYSADASEVHIEMCEGFSIVLGVESLLGTVSDCATERKDLRVASTWRWRR